MTPNPSNPAPVAIVTGASRGIGRAAARALAERGFALVLNGRDGARLRDAARALGPARVETVAGDAADAAVRRAIVGRALEAFGRIDVLVNNAGHFVARRIDDYSPADLSRLVAVHVEATFFLSQLAIPAMRRQGGGAIVNVTTTLTERGIPGVRASAQAAVKGAVNALTKSLAHELGRDGIRVNAVAPGTVRTGIFGLRDEELDAFGPLQPLGRIGEADEIASAIVHLATAPFTTGVILPVDGGVLTGAP